MDEGSIAETLEKKLKVKPGSLLFLQTTTPLRKLPRLCSKFRCFTRDSVWTDRSDEVSPIRHCTQCVHLWVYEKVHKFFACNFLGSCDIHCHPCLQ